MASRATLSLFAATVASAVIIYFVHGAQETERKKMREGVHRDLERQLRKRKNTQELQQQLQLEQTLRGHNISKQER